MNEKVTDSLDQGFAPSTAQGVVMPDSQKRLKTWGEKKFDWLTYGGVALLGNETTSLIITKAAEDAKGNPRGIYKPFKEFFTNMKGKRFVPEYVWNGGLPKVIIALIGGMLMVPFVKYLEDNKGEIVRKSDRKHYGTQADTDPAIVAAHKEMDEAPKQTWGSLWKGRALTVVAAIGVDGLMGWKDAPSTKLFAKDSRLSKYSSMDRIASQVAEKTLTLFNASKETHPRANEWLKQGSWLMVLSTTLTVLFYTSSKIFATRRDEKIERREEALKNGTPLRDDVREEGAALEAQPTNTAEAGANTQPRAQISSIAHQATIAPAPQLAQGA